MKKLMIFLIAGLSLQSFAKVNAGANVIDKPQNELTKINSCEFLNKSDDLLKRVISQIKSGNKANEIFCDSDGTKMVYYLLQNGNYDLNIGIAIKVDNNTTNSEFKETFYKKLDEYKNLLKTINTAKIKKENLPDSEVVRFYGQIDENKFFVIGFLYRVIFLIFHLILLIILHNLSFLKGQTYFSYMILHQVDQMD